MGLFYPKMVHYNALCHSERQMSLKNMVLQLWPKMLLTNQNWWFFYQYLWKESMDILYFFAWWLPSREGSIWDFHIWLGMASCVSQPIRLFNQIWSLTFLEGIGWYFSFFQWRLSSRGGSIWNYQFDWVRLDVPLIHQYLWKKSIDILDVFCVEIFIKGGWIRDYNFWLVEARFTSYRIRLQDSVIINISERNQFIC